MSGSADLCVGAIVQFEDRGTRVGVVRDLFGVNPDCCIVEIRSEGKYWYVAASDVMVLNHHSVAMRSDVEHWFVSASSVIMD